MKSIIALSILFFCLNGQIFAQDPFNQQGTDFWGGGGTDDPYRPDDQSGYFLNDREFELYQLDKQSQQLEEQKISELEQQRQQELIERQKRQAVVKSDAFLISNVIYGVASGLLIGGWFAVYTATDARDRFRYMGTGAVLGGLVGMLIASKVRFIPSGSAMNSYDFAPAIPIAELQGEIDFRQSQALSFPFYTYNKSF